MGDGSAMKQPDSPLNRSIGVAGVIRWLIAVAATLAVGAAFADGHYGLGIAGVVFFVAAGVLGYRGWRVRQDAAADGAPPAE
jgi:hypothetical protein